MVTSSPASQPLLYNHMSFFLDYANPDKPVPCLREGSMAHFIYTHPKLTRFRSIMETAKQTGFLDGEQANCTLFIPTDDFLKEYPDIFFDEMDDGLARSIVSASTVNRKLGKDLVTSSPVCYLFTRNKEMRMYVTNISGVTRLNQCATVVKFNLVFDNGFIHIIDNLLIPNHDHFMN